MMGIEYPLAVAEMMADNARVMAAAIREFERLLGHLRQCEACYTNEPCLDRHFLIKAAITTTEDATRIARSMAPADQPTSLTKDGESTPPRP